MKDLISRLSRRERLLVMAAALLVLGTILHGLALQPFLAELKKMPAEIAEKQATLAWMQQASEQIRHNAPTSRANQGAAKISPMLAIDQSARKFGLSAAIKRLEPTETGTVQVWLKDAIFDDMLGWLDLLQKQFSITVVTLAVNPQPEPGYVEARITFLSNQGP